MNDYAWDGLPTSLLVATENVCLGIIKGLSPDDQPAAWLLITDYLNKLQHLLHHQPLTGD